MGVVFNESSEQILIDGLYSIRHYLNSEKFSQDIMVNKNDILLRIQEIIGDYDSAIMAEGWLDSGKV